MDYNSNLVRFFLLAPILPECLILFAIFQRRRHKAIPWFTIYIVMDSLTAGIGFYVYQKGNAWDYFITSCVQNTVMFAVAFMVLVELFRNLISDYTTIKKTAIRLLIVTGIVLLAGALMVGSSGSAKASQTLRMYLIMERGLMLVQVGMLVAMFAFSRFAGIGWRHYQFGIGIGYGLYACLRLALLAYVTQMGAVASYKSMIIEQIGYQCTVLLWTIYMLKEVKLPPNFRIPDFSEVLKHWIEALSEARAKNGF